MAKIGIFKERGSQTDFLKWLHGILPIDKTTIQWDRYNSSVQVRNPFTKSEFAKTVDPTVTDDSDDGYEVGSVWINVTLDKAFICVDATVGASVWAETTPTAGVGGWVDDGTIVRLTAATDRVSIGVASPPAGPKVYIENAGLVLELWNTTDAASNQVGIFRGGDRLTPAVNDNAYHSFALDDSTGASVEFARMKWTASDILSTSKDATLGFSVMSGNTLTEMLTIDGLNGVLNIFGNLLPDADNTRTLGQESPLRRFQQLYIVNLRTGKAITQPTQFQAWNITDLAYETMISVHPGTPPTILFRAKGVTGHRSLFVDLDDTTKKMGLDASGVTTGTTRTLTIPNADVTLAAAGSNSGLQAVGGITELLGITGTIKNPDNLIGAAQFDIKTRDDLVVGNLLRLQGRNSSSGAYTNFLQILSGNPPAAFLILDRNSSAIAVPLDIQNRFDAVSVAVEALRGPDRATPTNNDAAYSSRTLKSASGSQVEVARETWIITDVTSGLEDSKTNLKILVNGVLTQVIEISNALLDVMGSIKLSSQLTGLTDMRFANIPGAGIATGTAIGNSYSLTARDVDGGSDTSFIVFTAGNTPTADLAESVTKNGGYIYRAGGTDVPVTDGGTGLGTIPDGRMLYASALDTLASLIVGVTLNITSGTLNVVNDGSSQKVRIAKAGTEIGNRNTVNFIEGANVTLTIADNAGSNRVDVTVAATGGGGGGGWVDDGTVVRLETATDRVSIGVASPPAGPKVYIENAGLVLDLWNTLDAASNQIVIFRGGDRLTPATNDEAYHSFYLDDSAGASSEFVRQRWIGKDISSTSKDGILEFDLMLDNVLTQWFQLKKDTRHADVGGGTISGGELYGTADRAWFLKGQGSQKTIAAAPTGASRATNVVTITTTAAHGYAAADDVRVSGVTDTSFNGIFTIQAIPSSTTFTYNQTGPNATSGSGTTTMVRDWGLFTELTDELFDIGGNDGRFPNYQKSRKGGFFRFDTRGGTRELFSAWLRAENGTTVSRLFAGYNGTTGLNGISWIFGGLSNSPPESFVEFHRIASVSTNQMITLDNDESNTAFFDYQGNSAANASASISTWQGGGEAFEHIKVEVATATRWIPALDNPKRLPSSVVGAAIPHNTTTLASYGLLEGSVMTNPVAAVEGNDANGKFLTQSTTTTSGNETLSTSGEDSIARIWKFVWACKFSLGAITSERVFIGLSSSQTGNTSADDTANVQIGLHFNPALSANWRFKVELSGGAPTYTDTGVPPIADQVRIFAIESEGSDLRMRLYDANYNESIVGPLILNANLPPNTQAYFSVISTTTLTTAARTHDFYYFHAKGYGNE